MNPNISPPTIWANNPAMDLIKRCIELEVALNTESWDTDRLWNTIYKFIDEVIDRAHRSLNYTLGSEQREKLALRNYQIACEKLKMEVQDLRRKLARQRRKGVKKDGKK